MTVAMLETCYFDYIELVKPTPTLKKRINDS